MVSLIIDLQNNIETRLSIMKSRMESGNNFECEYNEAIADISAFCQEVDKICTSYVNSLW